ncbi:MAG: VOC family protein [Actinomycetales bacterium]|nr:VOC family protein [Actinomycetales bacterium]
MRVAMITVDTREPRPLAEWWASALGGRVTWAFDDDAFVVVEAGDGPALGFQRVAEPTPGKNRVHVDLTAPDHEAEAARLVAAGATEVARHEGGGTAWVVLADPAGNHFCVSREH